jgi:monoamine oxidase
MARTPLASRLQEIAAGRATTRRQFIGAAAAGTAAAAVWSPLARGASDGPVVIVGGGLAGLTAAYRLQFAGIQADVYDANSRWGGRCWTMDFGNGQNIERGGELIDTGHLEIRQLCKELRLPLDNLHQAEVNGTEPLYYFDGEPYTYAEAAEEFNVIYQKLHRDTSEASYPTTYAISTQRGRELDAMTVAQWIAESQAPPRLAKLLDVAYNIEFGAETDEQSALNLIYLLGYSGQGQLRLFGPSNEKYHVRGGNEQLVSRLVETLASERIHLNSPLTAIRKTKSGYVLRIAGRDVAAARVILALPFSLLRGVDTSGVTFSERKRWAIGELGMGTNSKLHVGFKTRHWTRWNNNGDTYADTGYQATWEVTRAQPGPTGVLVDYTGGDIGASFGTGSAASRAKQFLAQIEPVLPGISAQWDSRAHLQYWATFPWTKGSYSYYKPGQYTRFGGAESEPEGAIHFAGEHTTQDFQGYLNGAVFSGLRAAAEVKAAMGK